MVSKAFEWKTNAVHVCFENKSLAPKKRAAIPVNLVWFYKPKLKATSVKTKTNASVVSFTHAHTRSHTHGDRDSAFCFAFCSFVRSNEMHVCTALNIPTQTL